MEKLIVEIPSITQHAGYPGNVRKYKISNKCPGCGGKRAVKLWRGLSYDGSRRLNVDCWKNECGHTDRYSDIREEGTIVNWETKTTLELTVKKATK